MFIYRLTNVYGKWSRPNYNTVVATFCHNVARGLPIQINEPEADLSLCYIDDVIKEFLRALEGRPTVENGQCTVPVATGNDFADALAGSVLAAQNNAPIVLVDSFREGLPEPIANYLKKLKQPKPYIFGGTGPVSGALEAEIASLLSETAPGIDFEVT